MKGDRYELADGVNSAHVGAVHIGKTGHVAKTDAEAAELDDSPALVVNKGRARSATTHQKEDS